MSVRGVKRLEKASTIQEGQIVTVNKEKASIRLTETNKSIIAPWSVFDIERGKELQSGQQVFVYFDDDGIKPINIVVPKAVEDSISLSVAANRGEPEEDFDMGNLTEFLKPSVKVRPRQESLQEYGLGLNKPPSRPAVERPQPAYQPSAAEDDEYPVTISKFRLSIEKMRDIYPNSKVYLRSVNFISMRFDGWRKSRGDGNCYYRALGAAYIEHLARQTTGIEELDDFIRKLEQNEGYYRLKAGFNDSRPEFIEGLKNIRSSKANNPVVAMITAQSNLLLPRFDENLIREMRILTANSLVLNKNHPDIEPYAGELLDYYYGNIMKMGEDAEGLAFICLAEALKVVIQHITIDKDTGVRSDFFRPLESGKWPKMFVWLRPGHYDMIYSKEQMYTDGFSFDTRTFRPPEISNSDRVTLREQLYEEVTLPPPVDPRIKLPREFVELTLDHIQDFYDCLQRAKDVEWITNYAASFLKFRDGLTQLSDSLNESLPGDSLDRLHSLTRSLADKDFFAKISGLCKVCKKDRGSIVLACGHRYCKPCLHVHVASITNDKMLLAPHEQPTKPLACQFCNYQLTSLDLERLLEELFDIYQREKQLRSKEYEYKAMQSQGKRQCKYCSLWKEESSGYIKAEYCKHACADCVRKLRGKGELACREDGIPWPELPRERAEPAAVKVANRNFVEPAKKPVVAEHFPKPDPVAVPARKVEAAPMSARKIEQVAVPARKVEPIAKEVKKAVPAKAFVFEEEKAPFPASLIKSFLSMAAKPGEKSKICEGCLQSFAGSQFPQVFCKEHLICQNCYLGLMDELQTFCPCCNKSFDGSLILKAQPKMTCTVCNKAFIPNQGVACGCTCEGCRDDFECAFCAKDFTPPSSPDEPLEEVKGEVLEIKEVKQGKGSCSFCHDEVMLESMKTFNCDHSFCRSCAACIEAMQLQSKDCPLCERRSARASARVSLRRLIVDKEPPRIMTRQCPICMNPIQMDDIRTLDCDHYFCTSCLTEHITWKVKENDLAEGLKCPSCPSGIDGQIVQDLIDDDLWFKFNYFSIKRLYSVVSCVMCKFEFSPGNQRNAKCPSCKYHFCTECIEKAHKGNCKQYMIEKALNELEATGEVVSQCPGCMHPYLKDKECDHVKCVNPKCLAEFCFECSCFRSPTLVHGNHYHRPECRHYFDPGSEADVYKEDCTECKKLGKLCNPPEPLQEPRRFPEVEDN